MTDTYADHITYGLWVGPIEEAAEHADKYDTIISVCQDARTENVSDETPYYHIPLADDEQSEAEWGGSCSYATFREAANTLEEVWYVGWNDEDILIHCHHGKNRSVAVTAAVVSICEEPHLTVEETIDEIQYIRPIADPSGLMRSHAKRWVLENK